MWTIIVRDPQGQEIARSELQAGTVALGRSKDCGIVLPSGSVSRKHARFEVRGDKLFFIDEGSANGSLVDGRRIVAPMEVSAANAIEITPFRIAVEGGDDEERTVMLKRPAPPAPPPASPRPVLPPSASTTMTRVPPPPRPAAAPAPPPFRPAPPPAAPPASAFMPEPTLADLRPVAPPPPPKPAAPSQPAFSEAAFTVRFPETSKPAAPVPRGPSPTSQTDSDAGMELERHIQGIRSYREQADSNTNTRQIQLEEGWKALVISMQALKARLANNPRLQGFGISRDGKEVTIRLAEPREKRGYRYFVLSRHHPQGKFPGLDAVWVCETGREDQNFRDPKDAQTELLQRIASTLA